MISFKQTDCDYVGQTENNEPVDVDQCWVKA